MSLIKLEGKTILQGKTIFDGGSAGYQIQDANAASYITAVQTADGDSLEDPVKQAIDQFIIGCKSDGIWSALKASCILAGARTLNGALVPLVGTAPTNLNFVSADYNRKTGLKGNGSSKYLSSGRNNNVEPPNNFHLSVYASEVNTTSGGAYIGAGNNSAGASCINRAGGIPTNDNIRSRQLTAVQLATGSSAGFKSHSRSLSTSINYRVSNVNGSGAQTSSTPFNEVIRIFSRGAGSTFGNPRISFYSIGESLDLALLDTRVTNLMTALNAAI